MVDVGASFNCPAMLQNCEHPCSINACHRPFGCLFRQCIPCSYRSCYSTRRRFKLASSELSPPKLRLTFKTNTLLVVGAIDLRGALCLPGFDDEPSSWRISSLRSSARRTQRRVIRTSFDGSCAPFNHDVLPIPCFCCCAFPLAEI